MKRKALFFAMLLMALHCVSQVNIIPMPKSIHAINGKFVFGKNTVIHYSNASFISDAEILKRMLKPAMGFQLQHDNSKSKSIILLIEASEMDSIGQEGYLLNVKTGKIEITASHSAGFFYAFQTLLQLMPAEIYSHAIVEKAVWEIDGVIIKDQPLLSWRGSMLDVSRQFYHIDYLKKYINWLAAHKLNVFHLHLTDDEGWRIEIKALPKLTEIGAWRGPDEALPPAHGSGDKRYGGFYTQDELKDLVKYAAERNIQILPEIDVPGHSKSVAAAYPEILCAGSDSSASVQGVKNNVWCAGSEANFEMLDKIIAEVAAIFPMEYIHIGGDEVNHKSWEHCPFCTNLMQKNAYSKSSQIQNYFIARVQKMLEKQGKKMMGWNEILHDSSLSKNTGIMAWTSVAAGMEAVHKQYDVILTPASYFYLDMAQGNGERGHKWATFLPLERLYSFQIPTDSLSRKFVKGIQANLWAEYLDKPTYQTEYQSYPRLCALADLAWSGNSMSFQHFQNRLNSKHYDRMFYMGIHFRVPPPVVKIQNGKLIDQGKLNHGTVYYTTDGSLPTNSSDLFSNLIISNDLIRNVEKLQFRNCFRDSLFSPSVSLAFDTVAVWNNSILSVNSQTLKLAATINYNPQSNHNVLLFKYLYGGDKLGIKRIALYKKASLLFEKMNEKPIFISSRMPEWEVLLPLDILLEGGLYHIEIEIVGELPRDSNGVILHIPR